MSSLPPPAPSSLALPTEFLAALFSFFTLRQRLRILALVCRRWQAVAYRSVTSVEDPYKFAGSLRCYPNLTSCALPRDGPVERPSAYICAPLI